MSATAGKSTPIRDSLRWLIVSTVRGRHVRVLGLRETIWFYAVAAMAALALLRSPDPSDQRERITPEASSPRVHLERRAEVAEDIPEHPSRIAGYSHRA